MLLIHDAFMGLAYWTGFMTNRNRYQGVSFDTHSYSIFSSPELALNWGQHINVSYSTVCIPPVVTASFIGGVRDRKGYLPFYSVQSLGHRWRVDPRQYRLRQVSAIFEVHFFSLFTDIVVVCVRYLNGRGIGCGSRTTPSDVGWD